VKVQIDKLKARCLEIRSLFVLLLIVSAGLWFSGRNAGAQDPSQTPPQAQGQRTNRSQAYLKLLEGQRHYSGISEGDADTKLKAAEAAFKEAIALNPDLIEAHTALAEVSFYLQNFDQTVSEAQAAIKLSPNNLGAHKVLSRVYSIKSGLRETNPDPKAVELAVAELKEVVRIDKDNSEGWALLGDFYREQGKTDEAIDAYKHWSTSPPSSDKRFFQIFTQGRDLSPDAAFARLADTLIAAGKAREGVAAARQALAANPENKEYGELLGRALEAEGGDSPGQPVLGGVLADPVLAGVHQREYEDRQREKDQTEDQRDVVGGRRRETHGQPFDQAPPLAKTRPVIKIRKGIQVKSGRGDRGKLPGLIDHKGHRAEKNAGQRGIRG